jgi:prepilin-type N-terminal cleavage/methylation domain-containing protein
MGRGVKGRFLREERGFTLIEMMITTIIWIVVLMALYSVFDMSITAFRVGNNKVEAVEGARLGLERMEREIRQAYVLDRASGPQVFETSADWSPTQIRFGNDLDGSKSIECPNTATPPQCERIGYQVYDPPSTPAGDYALGRSNSAAGTLQPAVGDVDYVSATDTGLAFTYCQRVDGTDTVPNDNCLTGFDVATSEETINMVRIQLRVRVDGGNVQDSTQTLTTDVALRNRDGI